MGFGDGSTVGVTASVALIGGLNDGAVGAVSAAAGVLIAAGVGGGTAGVLPRIAGGLSMLGDLTPVGR